jgi:2,5-diamino-6-(ribosylamino)-4(3H)-pyrimidinone 5'-phosphate reductase
MKRPQVIINCAMSADGKIALPSRKQLRISCDEDIKRMYNLRDEVDAVLVGIGTILSDDPKLTVKEKYVKNPKQPLRIILDSECRTPKDALAVNDSAKTLIITKKGYEKQFDSKHVEVIGCATDNEGYIDLNCTLDLLYNKGVEKLLVEGGSTVIWSFLNNKIVDDFFVYIGPYVIGGKDTPTVADGSGIKNESELLSFSIVNVKRLGEGALIQYRLL